MGRRDTDILIVEEIIKYTNNEISKLHDLVSFILTILKKHKGKIEEQKEMIEEMRKELSDQKHCPGGKKRL